MYRIAEGNTSGLADVEEFVNTLTTLDRHVSPDARSFFTTGADLIVTRAPGRLDVMGGIADYSGSLVLQLPIREATLVALERIEKREIQIVSLGSDADRRPTRTFRIALAEFENNGNPADYADVRARFQRDSENRWAAYVAGVFLVLMREKSVRFNSGACLLIESHVPEGKGVSSSAALEVAVMCAVAAAENVKIEPSEVALLCQKVENLVVGAPCGVMDQMTAACGQANRLLALLCQPAQIQGFVPVPEGVTIAGLDSGVRHAVTGAAYGDVRAGAFIGYRMIAELAKLRVRPGDADGPLQIEDPRWRGYLANIEPSEFEKSYARFLPEEIDGADFLACFGGTTDAVTRVHPERKYKVRTPAAHPVHEHFRVRAFRELLQGALSDARLELLGELMYQSHAGYSSCGLGEECTDRLVQLCRKSGPARGAYGAKITGGGSGGTVAILGRQAEPPVQSIVEKYARETGHKPHIFTGSSPGAMEFGVLRLRASS
ncbi:MAG: galactokinase family protein [Candidatus Acidiferrales bacterium]